MGGKTANKAGYFDKLKGLLEEYRSVFIVSIDNVSSQQMHEVRHSLRGDGVVLMGKNTMVRRALKTFINDTPEYERLLPFVKGNVGFVFTNGDLKEIRDKLLANRVAAPARAGAVAPVDVWIPAGNTGMEPGKTSFFQALGVPTKIARGTIEITTDLKLVEAGNKVGPSEATLLNMMNISPFTYGLGIEQVYDQGQAFPAEILDIGEEQLLGTLSKAITTIATISLAINFPTLPSVMHSVVNSYKNILAVAVETEISWPEIEDLKDRIANPEAYAAAAPAAAAASGGAAAAPAEEEKKEESEDEDEEGFGGLLCVHSPFLEDCSELVLTFAAVTKRHPGMTALGWLSKSRLGLRYMHLPKGYIGRLMVSQDIWKCPLDTRHVMKAMPHMTTHTNDYVKRDEAGSTFCFTLYTKSFLDDYETTSRAF
ncbi:60S acidic ribosomal protein P0 [Metarhizium acridum CQMa 102]|uniref:Large ribosomal subunit protein uL10 n=1 Tax=Metarhizium acridum (strain CQMa 102) TaxID=655827 RepID=E9DTT9_METAQ|nr:60S acidic ribosomal protein P0 [Metarhizium acridum CQMa 102]EFY92799.1 60S acidic ribosomal protein P0 [Metarhizium acridum CQMa 102]